MTLSSATSRMDYTGNGATSVYAYSFRILANTDLLVTVRDPDTDDETTLVITTDYTVSGVGDSGGGNVTLVNASQAWLTAGSLTTNWALSIRRVRPLTQTTDIRNQGDFYPEGHEDAFDHQVMLAQQLDDVLDRALKLPETEVGTAAKTTLPVDRASKVLAFDASSNPIAQANVPTSGVAATSFMETLLDDETAAAARTTLGAAASPHVTQHITGGADPFTSMQTIEAICKRLQETGGPTTLALGAIADGQYVARSGATLAGVTVPTVLNSICDGRLTLSSGNPIADTGSSTSVYFTPYRGNRIALYSGSAWAVYTFSELTLALGTVISGKNYDVWAYVNAGAAALELSAAWTSDTARSEALALQDGVLVKSGAPTRRYLGTIRTISTTATTDTMTQRYCWNYYHRVARKLYLQDDTDHTYTTATWQQYRATAGNKVEWIVGDPHTDISTDSAAGVYLEAFAQSGNPNASDRNVGIGHDSTSDPDAINGILPFSGGMAGAIGMTSRSSMVTQTLGYHYAALLQWSTATGTSTWYDGRLGGWVYA